MQPKEMGHFRSWYDHFRAQAFINNVLALLGAISRYVCRRIITYGSIKCTVRGVTSSPCTASRVFMPVTRHRLRSTSHQRDQPLEASLGLFLEVHTCKYTPTSAYGYSSKSTGGDLHRQTSLALHEERLLCRSTNIERLMVVKIEMSIVTRSSALTAS